MCRSQGESMEHTLKWVHTQGWCATFSGGAWHSYTAARCNSLKSAVNRATNSRWNGKEDWQEPSFLMHRRDSVLSDCVCVSVCGFGGGLWLFEVVDDCLYLCLSGCVWVYLVGVRTSDRGMTTRYYHQNRAYPKGNTTTYHSTRRMVCHCLPIRPALHTYPSLKGGNSALCSFSMLFDIERSFPLPSWA